MWIYRGSIDPMRKIIPCCTQAFCHDLRVLQNFGYGNFPLIISNGLPKRKTFLIWSQYKQSLTSSVDHQINKNSTRFRFSFYLFNASLWNAYHPKHIISNTLLLRSTEHGNCLAVQARCLPFGNVRVHIAGWSWFIRMKPIHSMYIMYVCMR